MIQRPLWTLPISDVLLNKFKDAGFEYLEDILHETNKPEVKKILKHTGLDVSDLAKVSATKTALELYKEEAEKRDNIVTFSKSLDDLFLGGIPTGKITELAGAPGSGKTQICFQLCVSVQIPIFLGGLNGSAAYICTNSNFSTRRIKEVRVSCIEHCVDISKELSISNEDSQCLQQFVEENPLNRVIRYSVNSVEELRACIFLVQKELETSNQIKLIVIDSFTFPFYTADTNLERTKIITETLIILHQLASSHHLAVVVTNELTTSILDNGVTEINPSLGESFAHIIHNRLLLGKKKRTSYYTALLCKSSDFPSESANFEITRDGIRDVPDVD